MLRGRFFLFGVFCLILAGTVFAEGEVPSVPETKESPRAAFQKGKNFYDQGKYAEAFKEWDSAGPYVEGSAVKKTIDFLRSRVKNIVVSPTPEIQTVPLPPILIPAQMPETAPSLPPVSEIPPAAPAPVLVKAPEEIPPPALPVEDLQSISAQAGQKLEALAAANGVAKKSQDAAAALKNQKKIEASFRKGKALFGKGHYEEALKEWRELAPAFEDPARAGALIQDLEKNTLALRAAEEALRSQEKEPKSRLDSGVSERLEKILSEANSRLISNTQSEIKIQKEKDKQSEDAARKTGWIEKTFEAGKTFFEKDQMDKAAETWEELLPYLANKDEVRRELAELRENRQKLGEIKELLKDQGVPRPETARVQKELEETLREAKARFASQTPQNLEPLKDHTLYLSTAGGKKAKVNKDFSELQGVNDQRRSWIQATFEAGKDMYESGRTREAFQLWETLKPYLRQNPQIKAYIDKASVEVTVAPVKKI